MVKGFQSGGGVDHEHDVEIGAKDFRLGSQCFSKTALEEISTGSRSDLLRRRNPDESRAWKGNQSRVRAVDSLALGKDNFEARFAGSFYQASRARPFNRRRLRTLRPSVVLMRTRKPCVVCLCRLFGWYVRFI